MIPKIGHPASEPGRFYVVYSSFHGLFDMSQRNDCYRTQFGKNACGIGKIAVPLHRQKTLKLVPKAGKRLPKRLQDNIIKVGAAQHTVPSKEKKG